MADECFPLSTAALRLQFILCPVSTAALIYSFISFFSFHFLLLSRTRTKPHFSQLNREFHSIARCMCDAGRVASGVERTFHRVLSDVHERVIDGNFSPPITSRHTMPVELMVGRFGFGRRSAASVQQQRKKETINYEEQESHSFIRKL